MKDKKRDIDDDYDSCAGLYCRTCAAFPTLVWESCRALLYLCGTWDSLLIVQAGKDQTEENEMNLHKAGQFRNSHFFLKGKGQQNCYSDFFRNGLLPSLYLVFEGFSNLALTPRRYSPFLTLFCRL
jgi:hypothetical protein